MRAFLAPSLPTRVALVARLSRAPEGWTRTTFRDDQDTRAFPPGCRFAIAHLPGPTGPGDGLKLRVWPSRTRLEGFGPRPRPRTGQATFVASGAKCELPVDWRSTGIPLAWGCSLPESVARRGGCAGWRTARCVLDERASSGPRNPQGAIAAPRGAVHYGQLAMRLAASRSVAPIAQPVFIQRL